MRDRVFTGRDVAEALASAATALGLPAGELRHVVLDAGSAGGRGLEPTPARVAVLVEGAAVAGSERRERQPQPRDARAGLRAAVRSVAEAAGIDVSVELVEENERVVVHLSGPDAAFFFGREGRGDVLRATEHLLQRAYGAEFLPRPLRVECEGFQEGRDRALREQARELASAVRADGQPRTTEPLNAYERRVVHLALNDEQDLTTFSVGQGAARRVTVARAEEKPPTPAEGEGGQPLE
jgi:spoIIIJ-associated protein